MRQKFDFSGTQFQVVKNPILTPAEAIAQFEGPKDVVRVQGIVTRVYQAEGMSVAYGDISYGDGVIGFDVPAHQAPAMHTAITLTGVLSLRCNRNLPDYRYQLHVSGKIEGTFEPQVKGLDVHLERDNTRRPLAHWFSGANKGKATLLVLCSNTAEQDMRKVVDNANPSPSQWLDIRFEQVRFHPATRLAETITSLAKRHQPDLIAIARGGGAANEIGASANSTQVVKAVLDAGVPLYTAIGHEHDLTLLDKFSDEVFHTPSALGGALSILAIEESARREMVVSLQKARKDLGALQQKSKRLRVMFLAACGVCLLLGGALYMS